MWLYGDAGDRWPVQDRDIWQVGPHVLACGDLERDDAWSLLLWYGRLDYAQPNLVYVDPPWSAGNAASFRTKAGVPRKVNFVGFLDKLLDTFVMCRGHVFIEMGRQEVERLERRVRERGGRVLNRYAITYYRKNPCYLVHVAWSSGVAAGLLSPEGMDDEDTPEWAIVHYSRPGDVVFDPCLGRGLTAVSADKLGRRCLGMELHPRRLAVAIDKLAKAGHEPQRVGSLPEEVE